MKKKQKNLVRINNVFLTFSKQKMADYLHHNQHLNLIENWDFSQFEAEGHKIDFSRNLENNF